MKNNIHDDNLIKHEKRTKIRLNKRISDLGYTSRRQADKLIEAEKVFVNGEKAVIGMQVSLDDEIVIEGTKLDTEPKLVYIMLNKPRGITTSNDPKIKDNIKDFVNYPEMIFPIGRLDKDSSGLILLTNDGDIVNKILRKEYGHEKEYVVTVDKVITDEFISKLEEGVKIYNPVSNSYEITDKAKLTKTDDYTFKIIIKQGLNRQIRRMTRTQGYTVKSLRRIRIINLTLGDLKVGKWRYLTNNELKQLNKDIND